MFKLKGIKYKCMKTITKTSRKGEFSAYCSFKTTTVASLGCLLRFDQTLVFLAHYGNFTRSPAPNPEPATGSDPRTLWSDAQHQLAGTEHRASWGPLDMLTCQLVDEGQFPLIRFLLLRLSSKVEVRVWTGSPLYKAHLQRLECCPSADSLPEGRSLVALIRIYLV